MLGVPNEGVHSIRVFNVAIIDVVLVFIVAYILYYYTDGNFWMYLIVLFILGIILHRVFCVRTTIDKLLFS
jgi:hypothetical protein